MTALDLYASGWFAPSNVELDLYGLDPHGECEEFCVATHKPGVCVGTKRGAGAAVTPARVVVPAAPARDTRDLPADNQAQANLQQWIALAQQHADRLGAKGTGAKQAAHDYGRALHQRQQVRAAVDKARAAQQGAHDKGVAAQGAADLAAQHTAAQAAVKAAHKKLVAHAKGARAAKAAAKRAQAARPLVFGALTVSDLYALGAAAELYAVMSFEHAGCTWGEFCRNPLHPGPCKGWKHTLHAVAPGAYHVYEKSRVQKANERRLAKVKALQDAGEYVPASLLKEITYDPAKLKPSPDRLPEIPAATKRIAGKVTGAATSPAHVAGSAQQAYSDLLAKKNNGNGYIAVSDLRKHPLLKGLTKEQQDAGLLHLTRTNEHAAFVPESNQKVLPEDVRAGALMMGNIPRHYLQIVDPSIQAKRDAARKATGQSFGTLRTAELYALMSFEHQGCVEGEFCRNPLHPGPCKGWKHTLKQVAPELHRRMEADRIAQVHDRRKAKIAELERAGKKVPAHLRRPLKGDTPAPADAGEPAGPLSAETVALAASVRDALPHGQAGWRALWQLNDGGTQTRLALRITNFKEEADLSKTKLDKAQSEYAQALAERTRHLKLYREKVVPGDEVQITRGANAGKTFLVQKVTSDGKAHLTEGGHSAEPPLVVARSSLKVTVPLLEKKREVDFAKNDLSSTQMFHDHLVDLSKMSPDQLVKEQGQKQADVWLEKVARPATQIYPKDKNGKKLPPAKLIEHHDAIKKVGSAMHDEVTAAFTRDPEWQKANDDRRRVIETYSSTWDEHVAAYARVAGIERQHVLRALSQIRPLGGVKHDNVIPEAVTTDTYGKAPSDWEEQLAVASEHLPQDWLRISAGQKMHVASDERAYYARATDTLAMSKEGTGGRYDGGMPSYRHEVTLHEMGHRMEALVPGLTALEFAYVRQRTTGPDGVVEPTQPLRALTSGSYGRDEVAYRDKFHNPYTGKSYEGSGYNPAESNWEAFQVGLQDLFGRGRSDYGGDDLRKFTLGVLATLASGGEG